MDPLKLGCECIITDGSERWRLSFTARDSPKDWINVTCWGQHDWILKISEVQAYCRFPPCRSPSHASILSVNIVLRTFKGVRNRRRGEDSRCSLEQNRRQGD